MIVISLSFIICHLSFCTLGAQTYTQRLQKKTAGQGTVTVHHSKAIDDLVNGPNVNTAPAAPKKVEQMQAPFILQPESIFGYQQVYTQTIVAQTDTNFITIQKDEVVRLSEDFLVFRLNLLNIFATQTQKLSRQPWRRYPQSLRERLVRFFVQHCVYPAGPKMFHILMNQLAGELNDSRLNVSKVLNEMKRENLVILHRGRIEIPLLERVLMS